MIVLIKKNLRSKDNSGRKRDKKAMRLLDYAIVFLQIYFKKWRINCTGSGFFISTIFFELIEILSLFESKFTENCKKSDRKILLSVASAGIFMAFCAKCSY